MPTPAMNQPINMAPGPAADAMFWGRAKIPEPMVEPIIMPTRVQTRTVC